MNILFIVPYSTEGASNRFRVEQYLPYLDKEGIKYNIRPFISSRFYKILYSRRKRAKKIVYFIQAFLNRMFDIIRLRRYDLVFIHRESCPFGPPIFEWLIYKFRKPIVYDFDDAIFLQNYNLVNRFYRFLKFPSKTKKIIKMASSVIVPNIFLKEYACRFNEHVYIIPTPIDTDRFKIAKRPSNRLTIGWVGSFTTMPYLKVVFNAMQQLSKKYDFVLKIFGAGETISIPGVKIENHGWHLQEEVEYFQSIDIGIYPLIDTLWARGKAGFKAIQYMAVGVPVVASSIGMNEEITQDGVNGFLVSSDREWIDKISRLIENSALLEKMGLAGRRTVEDKYSVKVNFPRFLEVIEKAVG